MFIVFGSITIFSLCREHCLTWCKECSLYVCCMLTSFQNDAYFMESHSWTKQETPIVLLLFQYMLLNVKHLALHIYSQNIHKIDLTIFKMKVNFSMINFNKKKFTFWSFLAIFLNLFLKGVFFGISNNSKGDSHWKWIEHSTILFLICKSFPNYITQLLQIFMNLICRIYQTFWFLLPIRGSKLFFKHRKKNS